MKHLLQNHNIANIERPGTRDKTEQQPKGKDNIAMNDSKQPQKTSALIPNKLVKTLFNTFKMPAYINSCLDTIDTPVRVEQKPECAESQLQNLDFQQDTLTSLQILISSAGSDNPAAASGPPLLPVHG